MNEHADLKAKIDEEPLNGARPDSEVLAWLGELETGPWIDVGPGDYGSWCARWKLPGRMFHVRAKAAEAVDLAAVTDHQSAAHMLHEAWARGEGLELSNQDVLDHLADSVGAGLLVSTAARDDLLAVGRPDSPRWVNAGWSSAPILGDVVAARAL